MSECWSVCQLVHLLSINFNGSLNGIQNFLPIAHTSNINLFCVCPCLVCTVLYVILVTTNTWGSQDGNFILQQTLRHKHRKILELEMEMHTCLLLLPTELQNYY